MIFLLPTVFLSLFSVFNLFGINQSLFRNQLIYFLIGFGIYWFVKKVKNLFFYQNYLFFYWLFLGFLILTFFLGLEVKGGRRWLNFFIFRFQASEFFKIFFILFLANYFKINKNSFNQFKVFIKSLIFFLIPGLLIFKQPDLGNALSLFVIYLSMLFFSRVPKKYIWYLMIFLLILTPFGWFIMKDYQRIRLTAFINPQIDQKGVSYNMIQSIITVGSGKFFGSGLGLGTQSRLYFLPESHSDFAFASLVEQFGFLGGLVIILLYFFIVLFLIKKAKRYFLDQDRYFFQFLFFIGFLTYIAFNVIVNIGMNIGIMPITGISLPLISYGGSVIVSYMLGLALLPDD